MLVAAMMIVPLSFTATAYADALPTLPSTWDQDMSEYFPDPTLRQLVTEEAQKEFAGQDLSKETTKDVLAQVKGSEGRWDLAIAFYAANQAGQNLADIKLLNGIQYLTGLNTIDASNVYVPGSGLKSYGIGLETLAMPGIANDTRIPDLQLVGNPIHILPSQLYQQNFPTTANVVANVGQNYYHHSAVTYVRTRTTDPKAIKLNAGIYKIADNTAMLRAARQSGSSLPGYTLTPILNRMHFQEGTPDLSFTTAQGVKVSDPDDSSWTITGFDGTSVDGIVMTYAAFPYVINHYDGGNSPDKISLSYSYAVNINYLSTVKQNVSAVTLGDFKFTKTSESTGLTLPGAEFRVKDANGRYLLGSKSSDGTYSAWTDENGTLKTTTNEKDPDVLAPVSGSDGTFTVTGVPGSASGVAYTVTEVKAPEGYTLPKNPTRTVIVRVNAGTATSNVTGGEGTTAQIAKDDITATADQWTNNSSSTTRFANGEKNPNGTNIDYTKSGEAMSLEASDGSAATETKTAKDYGGDVFITNGGNSVELSISKPSSWKSISTSSTLQDGTGTTLETYDDVDSTLNMQKASAAINTIIAGKKMEKDTDNYTVTTKVVYHDTDSLKLNGGEGNTISDPAKPGTVKIKAHKNFGGKLSNDDKSHEFTFTLSPADETSKKFAPKDENVTVKPNEDAEWALQQITAQDVKDHGGKLVLNYTAKEQPATNDADAEKFVYDTSTHTVQVTVTEGSKGLEYEIAVDGDPLEVTTTPDGAEAVIVTTKDPAITFTNSYKTKDFEFTKVDGETDAPLAGAVFDLYQCKPTEPTPASDASIPATEECSTDPTKDGAGWSLVQTQTSGEDGTVLFSKLELGTYRLVESRAPDGYLKPVGQWQVIVAADGVKVEAAPGTQLPPAFENGDKGYRLANYKPQEIPTTGDTGLNMLIVAGTALLLAGATVLSITSRRRID